jgi:hypothetical protein
LSEFELSSVLELLIAFHLARKSMRLSKPAELSRVLQFEIAEKGLRPQKVVSNYSIPFEFIF